MYALSNDSGAVGSLHVQSPDIVASFYSKLECVKSERKNLFRSYRVVIYGRTDRHTELICDFFATCSYELTKNCMIIGTGPIHTYNTKAVYGSLTVMS